MTTTQEALKMAIEAIKWLRHQNITNPFPETEAERACKEALEQPYSKCNPHPKAPHGFDRNSSHSADDYVCTCEGWDAWQDGYEEGLRKGLALEQQEQEPMNLLEALSDLEHQQWMKWAQSIIDSEPISEERKQRWLTMMCDYKDLPDNIQEYDREWARKVLAITHPVKQLSDDEIEAIDDVTLGDYYVKEQAMRFARAIEAKIRGE